MLVEDELAAVVRERLKPLRRRQAVLLALGVTGGRPASLSEVAGATGYSREGARHCLTALQRSAARSAPATPVLERALSLADQLAPCLDSDYAAALVDRGLARGALSYATLARCAEALARDPPASLRLLPGGAILRLGHVATYEALAPALRRLAGRSGAAQVERCAAMLAHAGPPDLVLRLVRICVTCDRAFRWIDAGSGWFWVPGGRNPMLNDFRKLLAVCSPIAIDSMHAGISRFYRRHGSVPPPEVLLEWCRQVSELLVSGDMVAAEPPLDPRQVLTSEELRLWEILRAHGGQMAERDLRREWEAHGGNTGTLRVLRMNAPFVCRPGARLYSLRAPGLAGGAGQDAAARTNEPAVVTAWAPGGKLTLVYPLTERRLREPRFPVPYVHWRTLKGVFRLVGPDGQDAGTVEVKVPGGVRLDALFGQARPQRGMHLELEFDLAARILRAGFRPEVDEQGVS